jgi:4-hydroxythreonine-4-phosphate dehydrogenase
VVLGEAAGIGPEVILAALAELPGEVHAELFVAAPELDGVARRLAALPAAARARIATRAVAAAGAPATPGESTPASRAHAFAALAALADAAVAGRLDAMLTGPSPKAIFAALRPAPPGQTEYLAGRLGATRFAMMLAGPRLRVVPVTTHLPLREVAGALRVETIVAAAAAAAAELRAVWELAAPRVGVCGLNPHAGEGGRLGDEEGRVIAPAIAALRAEGVDARGPLAADTAFRDGFQGGLDVVVAMYHDQALGPLKTVHFADAVNFTCGLRVPRASPDHGTAYDIAGRGRADPASACAALALACRAARARRRAA